jgi:lysozyme family protein
MPKWYEDPSLGRGLADFGAGIGKMFEPDHLETFAQEQAIRDRFARARESRSIQNALKQARLQAKLKEEYAIRSEGRESEAEKAAREREQALRTQGIMAAADQEAPLTFMGEGPNIDGSAGVITPTPHTSPESAMRALGARGGEAGARAALMRMLHSGLGHEGWTNILTSEEGAPARKRTTDAARRSEETYGASPEFFDAMGKRAAGMTAQSEFEQKENLQKLFPDYPAFISDTFGQLSKELQGQRPDFAPVPKETLAKMPPAVKAAYDKYLQAISKGDMKTAATHAQTVEVAYPGFFQEFKDPWFGDPSVSVDPSVLPGFGGAAPTTGGPGGAAAATGGGVPGAGGVAPGALRWGGPGQGALAAVQAQREEAERARAAAEAAELGLDLGPEAQFDYGPEDLTLDLGPQSVGSAGIAAALEKANAAAGVSPQDTLPALEAPAPRLAGHAARRAQAAGGVRPTTFEWLSQGTPTSGHAARLRREPQPAGPRGPAPMSGHAGRLRGGEVQGGQSPSPGQDMLDALLGGWDSFRDFERGFDQNTANFGRNVQAEMSAAGIGNPLDALLGPPRTPAGGAPVGTGGGGGLGGPTLTPQGPPTSLGGTLKNRDRQSRDSSFRGAVKRLIEREGGSQVFDDRGKTGEYSKFGINEQSHPDVDVENLTQAQAEDIYYTKYYEPIHGDTLATVSPRLMEHTFDFAVNSGPARAIKTLQEVVGATPDGAMGPQTKQAVRDFVEKWGEDDLLENYLLERRRFLKGLDGWKRFGRGWSKRLESLG